jgi:type IV pilus assembly protein PilN
LVRTLAKGVYFTTLSMAGNTLSVTGTAESNNRISSLMRSLDGSDWFTEPNLKGLTANSQAGEQASNFQLTVVQTSPKKAEGEADK